MTTPAAPVAPATPSADPKAAPAAPAVTPAPDADSRLKELEAQTKRIGAQQRKLSEEKQALERQRAESAQKLRAHEEWEATHKDRLRNPTKYLSKDFGDDWYDKLTRIKLEGAATPDLIASEMDSRLSDFEKKLGEREKTIEQRFEELKSAENQRVVQGMQQETFQYVRSNASKYVLINEMREDGVENAVWGEIEKDFRERSAKSEDGKIDLLTPEKAADIVEARLESYATKLISAMQKKKQATPGNPQQPKRSDTPQRRTLSTDMTAGSGNGERTPPTSEKERLNRSLAAWENALASRQ